jgi:hypothetical protein
MALAAVKLDFTHPTGRGSIFGPVLLVVGLLAITAGVAYQRYVGHEINLRETRLEELRGLASRSLPVLADRDADTPEVRTELQKANVILQQMNVPWGDLFTAVESAQGDDIALLAVQPDPRGGTVLIGGEARSLPAVLAYMERLEQTSRLRDVVLASHEIRANEPGQPVSFALNAGWEEGGR